MALTSGAEVQSEEPESVEPPPSAVDQEMPWSQIESWRKRWTERMIRTFADIDRLFGDQCHEPAYERSQLGVLLGIRFNEYDGVTLEHRLRLRAELPNLERRLLFFIDERPDEEAHMPLAPLPDRWRDAQSQAGLRLLFEPIGRARLSADAGARLGSDPHLFLRGRFSLTRNTPPWERRLSQSIVWRTHNGWLARTEARWTRAMPNDCLARLGAGVEWKEEMNGVMPFALAEWMRAVGRRRGFRLTGYAEWPETPHTRRARYTVEQAFRWRLGRDWLFLEAGPGVDFLQERDYDAEPFAFVRFELLFCR